MGKGYMGKILWVDLSRGTFKEEEIPEDVYRQVLTGYGLAAKVILERQAPGQNPLGAKAIFGVMSGLLTGTGAQFAGRWMVVGKSPLTGGWGDANCGGNFAPAIKKAGYDGIFFTGKSKKPVYLLIDGDKKSLVEAGDLWGTDAVETERQLRDTHGRAFKVACIGQGGEQCSLMAGVVNDRGRIAARSGLGAVMGSKKLKALCLNGSAKVAVHDKEKIRELSRAFRERLDRDQKVDRFFSGKVSGILGRVLGRVKTQPAMAGELFKFTLRIWGTSGIAAMSAETGDSPVKNWRGVGYRDFPIKTRALAVSDDNVTRFETKKYHCYSCPLGCGGICKVDEGPYPLAETHKPEYETLCAFGALLLIDDLKTIFQINEKLNRAGIDTISCGVTIAWAIECFERGLLSPEQADGLTLRWGDPGVVLELVDKVIAGEGIGKLLRNGVKAAAKKLGQGSEAWAIHAGGQELPMHDARFDVGYGLGYEVEPTPGRHTIISDTYLDLMALHKKTRQVPKTKLLHTYLDRYEASGKGRSLSVVSRFMDVINGCGLCVFGASVGGNMPVAEWINAATGWSYTFDEYLEIGRRIKTMRAAFNAREGVAFRDTQMTARARGIPPAEDGPLAGATPEFDQMAREYYVTMGWDGETGRPLDHTLDELGLSAVKAQLAD